jgi:ferredoxin
MIERNAVDMAAFTNGLLLTVANSRRARSQSEHMKINSREYPGTRQLCIECGEPTERCEEDAIYTDDGLGPFCLECYHIREEADHEGCGTVPK